MPWCCWRVAGRSFLPSCSWSHCRHSLSTKNTGLKVQQVGQKSKDSLTFPCLSQDHVRWNPHFIHGSAMTRAWWPPLFCPGPAQQQRPDLARGGWQHGRAARLSGDQGQAQEGEGQWWPLSCSSDSFGFATMYKKSIHILDHFGSILGEISKSKFWIQRWKVFLLITIVTFQDFDDKKSVILDFTRSGRIGWTPSTRAMRRRSGWAPCCSCPSFVWWACGDRKIPGTNPWHTTMTQAKEQLHLEMWTICWKMLTFPGIFFWSCGVCPPAETYQHHPTRNINQILIHQSVSPISFHPIYHPISLSPSDSQLFHLTPQLLQVRICSSAQRLTDPKYGSGETAFSDGFPVLVSSTASVKAVARKAPEGLGQLGCWSVTSSSAEFSLDMSWTPADLWVWRFWERVVHRLASIASDPTSMWMAARPSKKMRWRL